MSVGVKLDNSLRNKCKQVINKINQSLSVESLIGHLPSFKALSCMLDQNTFISNMYVDGIM